MAENSDMTADRHVVGLALDANGMVCGLGRAPRMAVAAVENGRVVDWRIEETNWDVLHDQGEHGRHHARIVRFMRQNGIDVAAAGHMGPPMINTLGRLGLAVVVGVPADMAPERAVAAVVGRLVRGG
ncbi:NifB/NifX family molybdenum-iron cluster-binding protein [uncultured Propionibacterium sp.]|uniref:NifB/NifX family molybdenum-iron cluster-binding protein n=1 Tax=uncultured Propionibacterium sp. TaxID=218066 RepID=UPI00293019E4|nr:NifB/NifX family molybdenum-iron cluster-binding protein [uncultured Propionibacterium sp.]